MEQSIKALADLREHWAEQGHPNVSEIAKRANIARATAHRYLNGETKGGTVETVRALAIAMGRPDIADAIPYTSIAHAANKEDYIAELAKQWSEQTHQQIADISARHQEQLDILNKDLRAHKIEKWIFMGLFVAETALLVFHLFLHK